MPRISCQENQKKSNGGAQGIEMQSVTELKRETAREIQNNASIYS